MMGLTDILQQLTHTVSTAHSEPYDLVANQRHLAELYNRGKGNLPGYDCPECLNRGDFMVVDDTGHRTYRRCKCMVIRDNERRIQQSGLADLLGRYTFESWQTPQDWQQRLAQRAKAYAEHPEIGWWMVAGHSGCGKSHICTAISNVLLHAGYALRYMLWREAAVHLKACVNDPEEYERAMHLYTDVQVLYIDDFLKCGKNQEPSSADLNIAFEILNRRYCDTSKITIISSERTLPEIVDLDEAVGGRIYERAHKGAYIDLSRMPNWRLPQ